MKKITVIFVLCWLALWASAAFAQSERFLQPVDEARKDASFFAFRAKLIAAAERRDAKYILSIVDPKISNTFGEDDGFRYFKNFWKLENRRSEFWDEFLPVITRGGTFSSESGVKQFCAPYTYTSFPADLDNVEHQAIFGNNVNLRAKPETNAAVVAALSYNIVKVDYENSVKIKGEDFKFSWLKVETFGGKRGFVKAEFVRSPLDYRACFEKKRGAWKMTVFISGD